MEFLMIILMATLLLAVVFGLVVRWGAWSEFQAEKNNQREYLIDLLGEAEYARIFAK